MRIFNRRFSSTPVLALASLGLMFSGGLHCQTTTAEICPGQTVFQFPLWSDASWKQFANYSSIQFADIDGDGQAELLGAGPNGVEAWHWDPAGQQWYQLQGYGPILVGPRDSIMAADVDGDGKAELIQETVATASSVTLNVFHYDPQPGVWRLLPKLTLTIPAITTQYQVRPLLPPAIQVSSPTFRFADLLGSGRQNLVYLSTAAGSAGLTVTPVIYSAQPDDSAWVLLASSSPKVTLQSGVLGSNFQIGTMANGLHQIILLDGANFLMLVPTAPITFSFAVHRPIPAAPSSSFVLVDFTGAGVDQVAFVLNSISGQTIYYSQDAASNAVDGTKLQTLPIASNLQDEAVLLRSAKTGLGLNANAKDLLGFAKGVLTEYGTLGTYGAAVVSSTPSVSGLRFEDDPSHYSTIQTGAVQTSRGATEYVLIARDAGALHTLVPSPNVCQSNAAGFTTKAVSWFPAFSTEAKTLAYAYISQQVTFGASSDLRATYANLLGDVTGYESSLQAVSYTATTRFTQADFNFVKTQLTYELESVANVRQFFTETQLELDSIYEGEAAALPSIFQALNAQPDTTADVEYENSITTAQTVLNDFYGVAAGILEFSELPIFDTPTPPVVTGQDTSPSTEATLFYDITSLVGTIISDVQDNSATSAGTSSGSQQTLGQISQQIGTWKTTAETNNAQAETQLLGNWDLLKTLSQRIAGNAEETTPEQAVATVNGAVAGWALTTWQALAPQFWNVVIAPYSIAYGSLLYSCILCSPYTYVVQGAESEPAGDPNPHDPNYEWVAWLEVQGAPYHDPVPAASMQQFTGSNINLLDVLARRNGWQAMPLDSSIPGFLNLNAVVIPPDPTPAPGNNAQLAANLIITGGSPANVYSCNGTQTELGQSTPVNSLYPEPVSIQVQDINGNGIPNATVSATAPTLVKPTFTITTDANGSATLSLEASGLVGNPSPATFSVTSPKMDPNASACQIFRVPYSLENTPSTQPGNSADLTAKFQIPSRTGGATSRTWQLEWIFNQATDAITGLGTPSLTIKQVGASSCPATVKSVTQPSTTDGTRYDGSAAITFAGTGCTGTRTYSVAVSTLAVLTLDDGSSYSVPITNSVSTQP